MTLKWQQAYIQNVYKYYTYFLSCHLVISIEK